MYSSRNKKWIYTGAIIAAFFWLIPLIWMILCSLKSPLSDMTMLKNFIMPPFTFENYIKLNSDSQIWRWTFNSLFISLVVTFLTLIICSLMAYPLSQIKFKGKRILMALIIIGLIVPIEATIIPLFQLVVKFHLVNTYSVLIFPCIASPLGVLILKQFYDAIPKDLVEAADIDGAGWFRKWWTIFLPLSKTSLAALGIFTFIGSWNNYLWPLLAITDQNMMTLPIAIPMYQSAYGMNVALPMTANVFASIPAIIIFLLFQKHIVKGITMTGIK